MTASTPASSAEFTLLIDAQCSLCAIEMRHLKRYDHAKRIELVDINSEAFLERFAHLDVAVVSATLHGQLADGTWLYGLDATHQAWSLVGLGRYTAWLRSRALRKWADCVYRWFARHRVRLSGLVPQRYRANACDLCRPHG